MPNPNDITDSGQLIPDLPGGGIQHFEWLGDPSKESSDCVRRAG